MIGLMILAAAPAADVAALENPSETRCAYIVTEAGITRTVDTPPLHVIEATSREGTYAPAIPAGAAIMCGRSNMAPAANDWKVVAAGHPLAIVDSAPGTDRLAWLEVVDGRVRYQFKEGQFTPAEMRLADKRIDAFQQHLLKEVPARRGPQGH